MAIKNLFLRRQESIISAASVIGITLLASSFLGLLKNRLFTQFYGDGLDVGLFYIADRVPNFIFSILVVGSFSAAFIPVFTKCRKKDEGSAWLLASQTLNAVLLCFFVLAILLFIFAPQVAALQTSHKIGDGPFETLVTMLRIMLLAQLILIISNFFSITLQSFKHFLAPALAPVLYNLGLIVGIVISSRLGIVYAAWGMVAGATLHLLIQLPLLSRIKFSYRQYLNFKYAPFLEMLKLLGPRTLVVGFTQLSLLIDSWLTAWVSVAAVGPYTFASQLQNLPLGVFGASISQALFTTLSQKALNEDLEEFKKTFLTSFMQLAFLVLPVAAVLLVLRVPMVRLAFGSAKFSWEATLTTSYVLAFLALAVFPQAASWSLVKAYYALHDTKTPLKISSLTTLLNITIALIFIRAFHFGVWGLSLAYLISCSLEFGGLLFYLSRKLGGFKLEHFAIPLFKILIATFVMAGFLYLPLKRLDLFVIDTSRTINLLGLTVIAGILGLTIYLILTVVLRVTEVTLLWRLLRKFPKLLPTRTPEPSYEPLPNS